jgi:hypothetical protein
MSTSESRKYGSAESIFILCETCHGFATYFDKSRVQEEFIEIVVNILDREEGIDRDIALLIADSVYNRLESLNIREYIRIARLSTNDSSQVNKIIDTFAKYGTTDTEL